MLFPFAKLTDDEIVARFVLFSKWVRSSDQTIRPDAFMPPPDKKFSVTRHKGISKNKLWKHGKTVAKERDKTLYGRADIRVSDVRDQKIKALPDPILLKNWNHACLTDWPEKPFQKTIAQQLAAKAQYRPL